MSEQVKFRALFASDLHLSNNLPHSNPGLDGVTDRFRDELNVLSQLTKCAKDNEVDGIFLLGDIFDKPLLDAVTLTHSIQALVDMAPIPVYVLPGNHDTNIRKATRFTVEMFGAMKTDHIHYLGDGTPLRRPGLTFWPLPYMPMAATRTRLAEIQAQVAGESDDTDIASVDINEEWLAKPTNHNILLFHQAILGCGHDGWTCDDGMDPAEVCAGFDTVLSGHFHTHQSFGPDSVGMYLGAPMQHHFGDAGDTKRGWWEITWRWDGPPEYVHHQSVAPMFHVVDASDSLTGANPGDYIRLVAKETTENWHKSRRTEVEGMAEELRIEGFNVHVQHKPVATGTKRMEVDSGHLSSPKALMLQYLRAMSPEGLDAKRLSEIGQAALDAVIK